MELLLGKAHGCWLLCCERREPSNKPYQRVNDSDRPKEAFTTERAVRNGRANAASGRILVDVPNDHFGPILPEHDPDRGQVSSKKAEETCTTPR